MGALALKPTAHVVDVLGNVIGRDQPILRMEKALEMVALLGEDVFADDNIVFFDPFCKAGELLLACAFLSCKAKTKKAVVDLDIISKEIYESNRYFGIAPDERHHRLSLRTFLGNEISHSEKHNQIIRDGHYVSEVNGNLDKEKYEEEFKSMIEYIKTKSGKKKIIAIGNPPYQESDGGYGSSASLIYPYFVEHLIDSKIIHELLLVIPSRWFAGGKNLDKFRERMIACTQLKTLRYFERSEEVFPTVQIKGGVCFLGWDSSYNGKTTFDDGKTISELKLSNYDIIPDDPGSLKIVQKLLSQWKGDWVSNSAWPGKPFGLRTFYFNRNESISPNRADAIPVYTNLRKVKYAPLSTIVKNADKINKWKVAIPNAYGRGMSRCTLRPEHYFIIGKGEATTETYNIVGCFETKNEAERFLSYLKTDFARYLLGVRKLTQHIPRDRWNWVPLMDNTRNWTDKEIASFFNLSKEEQEHIKKKVQEWS
jgi:hypothetical protein